MKTKIIVFYLIFFKVVYSAPQLNPSPAYSKFISTQITATIWMQGDYGVWYKKKIQIFLAL